VALALTAIAYVAPASASIVLQTANGSGGNQVGYSVGLVFQVNSAVTVDQLGMYDSGGDGFMAAAESPLSAYLMNTGGTVLASATFYTGSSGALDTASGYRFKSIAPLTIGPGFYYLMGYGFSSADPEHNSFLDGMPDTFNHGGGLLSFVFSAYTSDVSVGALPDTYGSPDYFSAANMTYSTAAEVPEPTSFAILVTSALAAAGLRGRARRDTV